MYEQVVKPKENKSRAVANSVAQKKSKGKQGFGFVDNRTSRLIQQNCSINETQRKVTQLVGDDIQTPVYYGHSAARAGNMTKDGVIATKHHTVDTLNEVIGLTNSTLDGLMGEKREVIRTKLNAPPDGASEEEISWHQWLKERIHPLLLYEMNGEQCRDDMGMESSIMKRIMINADTPKRNMVSDGQGGSWKQDSHKDNVMPDAKISRRELTDQFRTAHDEYIESDASNKQTRKQNLDTALPGDSKAKGEINRGTMFWLNGPVLHRFWRLTSKMGLDFFVFQEKQVNFVRKKDEKQVKGDFGAKTITDSEWEHANDRGYVRTGSVRRVDPK